MSSLTTKLSTAAEGMSSEAQSLIVDMRKAFNSMKSLAVDCEKEHKSEKVQELEKEVLELMASYEDCASFAEAVKAVPRAYQPSDQRTDFKRLIEEEVDKVKGTSRVSGQSQQLLRQFRGAVWDVHHAGQPMPGDEQEDIVMTSTQNNIVNFTCPITLKPVIELTDPVRCVDCRHIYDKDPIIRHIKKYKAPPCPVAGCPKVLQLGKIVCDSLLRIEIEELRSSGPAAPNATDIEDISDQEGDDDEDQLDEDEDDRNE